jgi:putative DNA primase/helicase
MSRTAEEYVTLLNEDAVNGPLFRGEQSKVKAAGGHARVTAGIRKVLIDDGATGPIIDAVLKTRRANAAKHAQNGSRADADHHDDSGSSPPADKVIPEAKLQAARAKKSAPVDDITEQRRRDTVARETAQSTAEAKSPYGEPDLTFDDDDIGNMDRFTTQFKGQLIWTKSAGWMHHDPIEGRWMHGDEYASQAGVQVVRNIKQASIDPRVSQARQNVLFKWGRTSATGGHIPTMIRLASQQPDFVTSELRLDRDIMLLNCPNGTLDLRTGILRPHDSADLITKVTGIEYDPDAESDLWDSVIEQATRGVDGLADFLRRAAGYTLTGSTQEDAVFILTGAGGTAKSSITQALEAVMGMYAKAMRAEALTTPGNSGHNEDIAVLAGARMAITGEADKADKMRDGLFKKLSGGDTVTASRKNKPSFDFKPQFKLWIVTNHVPKLSPDDSGIWRRVYKLPFENVIAKPDRTIRMQLQTDPKHMRAVLAWAVRGVLEWQTMRGLNVPPSIIEATEALRLSMDGLGEFFKRYVYINPDPKATLWTSSADLMTAYHRYAKDNDIAERFWARPQTLAAGLRFRGCTPEALRGNRDKGWRGVIVREEPDDE